jgi:hypothetical protein
MINKESIILLKTWVAEGRIFYDVYSHAYMLEEYISQADSEFYLVAPELTGLFSTKDMENQPRYSFCYGQLVLSHAKPTKFPPKPAKLYKITRCSYLNHEHHKSNLLSAITFASFHYGEGVEGGLTYLSESLSLAKTLNQIGEISDESTLIAAVLENIAGIMCVKIDSIEMLFGKDVRRIIEVILRINNCPDTNAKELLNELKEVCDEAKHVQLAILSGALKQISTLEEKEKRIHLSWYDQQAKVCESASSSLYHWYMVERSGLD